MMDFGTASYTALTAAGLTVTGSSFSGLQAYADNSYQYDAYNRVTAHAVQGAGCSACSGGQGVYKYSYANNLPVNPSGDPTGQNVWTSKFTEQQYDSATSGTLIRTRNLTRH